MKQKETRRDIRIDLQDFYKTRDLGNDIFLYLITTLSTCSLALSIKALWVFGFAFTYFVLVLISLSIVIIGVYLLSGYGDNMSIFIDKVLGLNNFEENKKGE